MAVATVPKVTVTQTEKTTKKKKPLTDQNTTATASQQAIAIDRYIREKAERRRERESVCV